MASLTRERAVAADALRDQRVRGARARELLRASEDVAELPARERGLVTRIVLGVVRTSGTLDAVLESHLRKGGHLEPRVRDALRVTAYELLYMGTPARVAVSQGVELVRRANRRAAGLANAVLRRVSEEDVPRMSAARSRLQAGGFDLGDLSLVAGLPGWLVSRLGGSLSASQLAGLALAMDETPPVYVAANAAKGGRDLAERLMREAGLGFRRAALPRSYVLDGGGALARSGLVSSGVLIPSDLAAQAVALSCAPLPGSRVLEVGQGRGTKSLLLENAALSAGGPCEILAVESEPFKIGVARKRMRLAGLSGHVRSWELDARALSREDGLPQELREPFDLALVDVPCSGTGTMRRHPEIPWSLDEEAVKRDGSLPRLQLAMLSASAARVRPGGSVAYATCSLLHEEDEDVVEAFLASEEGAAFGVVPFEGAPLGSVTARGYLRTLSLDPASDGHFCALLKRAR